MIGCGHKSSTNQSMLIWELTLYKSKVLTHQSIILSLILTFKKKKVIYNMPKATCKTKGEDDGDVPLHSAINEEEAKCYSQNLDSIINKLGTNIRDEVPNTMKEAVQRYQKAIATMVLGMEAADPQHSVENPKRQSWLIHMPLH